jgi:hypothetical protein
MDESMDATPYTLAGMYVNLFDSRLEVIRNPRIETNTRWLLYDLSRCPDQPWVIAAAGRVENEAHSENSLGFRISGMANTKCVVRARVPEQPVAVTTGGNPAIIAWDEASRTVLVEFTNNPEGRQVEVRW